MNNIFLNDLTKYMELHSFNKNEHICKYKEKLSYFYFLVHGKANVYLLLKNGKSLLLRFYKPLSLIGDVEFVNDNYTSSNIQVVEKTLCIGISMECLRTLALEDTNFLTYIINSLGDKLEKNSKSSSINLLYPLENRLASYLLAISSPKDKSLDINGISTYKLTEMADLLGTSYRHLLRTIDKFCKQNIIKKYKNSIIILDINQLEQLAGDIYE
ncbi:CRP-like cAMP-binding protein [Clostridium tetanomorphum]|uniref:Cyclic nucleotide-binding domain-containing protein n=2 Tax=Clostridium tetanomorphum TaxID=1553 RepID=A0A923J1M6_CLOTT|nr:cyclic nucleotide-binding domain-containing protein [Clostridium tetanomorphum]MBC2399342.1 cyclic nucleotide-binding domain-containing protein [Clostridium tetanomorphum]MBP1865867.1 CRP-like cAMP-binding protein [Clostridium tetanomorphum]NRS85316.1 CRP-like cAMP-binding protein [Clostridium tetanomorphum]